ncbi:MerR family transcriptional regulator [Mycobacterium sp. djl-10]|nr:MerR family transcriptional regulator [Mycobacterium sp. djl-10]
MAWSTREIAEIAGVSLRAVRHYHQVGLLAEPDRRSNGYKQYGVAHLVRLVRIKRLTDLGFSLPQIAEMGDADEHPGQALRDLDAELAATIARLQAARDELAVILEHAAPTDLPPEFVAPAHLAAMSDADRAMVVVLNRVLGPRGQQVYRDLLRDPPQDPAFSEFDTLPTDADESLRQDLAERLAPQVKALADAHPGLLDAQADAPSGPGFARRAIDDASAELYTAAQLDVLRRMERVLRSAT